MDIDSEDARKPRGFGRALADLFRELGYDEGELHPDMFEWLFGLPSMRIQAFLDWFLTSIRPRQSVKRQLGGAQDYAIYKKLLIQGLLSGEQLARAEMACRSDMAMQRVGEKDESLDVLLSGNASLEREIEAMEKKLELAHKRNDRLVRHAQRETAIVDGQTQRLQRQQDKDHFTEILAQSAPHTRREFVNDGASPEHLLRRIQSTFQHLAPSTPSTASTSLGHTASSSSSLVAASSMVTPMAATSSSSDLTLRDQPRIWKDFLYHHGMEELQRQEEQNLRHLQARIPAISAMTPTSRIQSSGEVSQQANTKRSSDVLMSPPPTSRHRGREQPPPSSPWLHESDPTQFNMREQDMLLYNKCGVELERLRKAFVVGERDALLAQLQVTRHESHLRQLTSSRRQLVQQFQLMNSDAIWARKQILQASLNKTAQQLGELFHHAFPEKLEELAFLKSTSILLHSYEQKLWRQENRFVKLRSLLEGFEIQHARLRLVHRLLDSEREDLMQINTLFQQLVTSLRQHNENTEQRICSYHTAAGSDAARATLAQSYLHEHDEVAHSLFDILERLVHHHQGDEPPTQLATTHSFRLRTFDDLVRLGELKCASEQSLKETTVRVQDEWKRLYDSKRSTLNQLRHEMFGDVTSSTPLLLPVEVATALQHASATKNAAESGLEKSLETRRLHRRSLQVDPMKRMQQDRDMARLQRELRERQ